MLQNIIDDMEGMETRLRSIAPQGYTLAVNIRYFTPEFYVSAYPEAWVELYTSRRYALFDPVTLWCRFNEGVTRWSDIEFSALRSVSNVVMEQAQGFGLRYGGAAALCGDAGRGVKSLLCGAREDRELDEAELADLQSIHGRGWSTCRSVRSRARYASRHWHGHDPQRNRGRPNDQPGDGQEAPGAGQGYPRCQEWRPRCRNCNKARSHLD